MLTAPAPPAVPGIPRQLPTAHARRQDSSGSSGSYHTAPGSPEPPDVRPDAEGRANWPWVAPGRGAGAQPRLSVSAQNSRQQHWPGSDFPRGSGSSPRPPQPQLRTLPSGEMEVIFGVGPLLTCSATEDLEVQQLMEPAFGSPLPPGPVSPTPLPPQPQALDGGSRWATYLELRPRGPSPAAPTQFECVEVALEEHTVPARPRTVPKRQIELRPRPQSPPRVASAPRPRLLLRTGSLDESLSRLQAAAGFVHTALARKLSPEAPVPSNAACRPTGRSEPETQETSPDTRVVPEKIKSQPLGIPDGSALVKAPRPWPSLRERAIRRDKPAPGTEPLGPVSSSIFLQSEEKIQEKRKTRFPQDTSARTVRRVRCPPIESGVPWEVPSRTVRPTSPSPQWPAANGAVRGPRCPSPQNLSPWDRTVRRVSSPLFPEVSSAWENQNPPVEEPVRRRSPTPLTPSQWNQGVARARSPSREAPSQWEIVHPAGECAEEPDRNRSPPALVPWEAPDRPIGTWSPSPQEQWDPMVHGSSVVFTREAQNDVAQEELVPSTPFAPGTPEPTEAQSPSTQEIPDLPFRGSQSLPETAAAEPPCSHLVTILDSDARPEAVAHGKVASVRQRVAIPRPRDVRKMVKTTYAPSFLAGTPGSGLPAPPADPCGEEGGASKTQELQPLGPPAPAHYTSIFLKDFMPVVPHPYEPPEPPLDTVPRDTSEPNRVVRRRAENTTAKPFARTEIRLPGALALGRRPEVTPGVRVRGPGGENSDAETQRLVPDGEGRTSPLGGARNPSQRSPVGPAGARPPRPNSPQAHPNSSPDIAPKLETPPEAPAPTAAIQEPLSQEPQASTGRRVPAQPRAASAPPTDRSPQGPSQWLRRPPGAAHPGKVLVDPESGRYYFVEAPRQPRLRLLFDPESGQYVEVLLPSTSPGPPRRVYTPVALGPGLYPPAYGLSLPPSPGPPALSSPQLPWVSEAGPLDGMYYLPVSGTPSPTPPLLLCAQPHSSGTTQQGKGSLFPL
ncbi:proline-rich basic protein 1 [Nycticebus coucang]|uniref:proline-rich basic protein 1 n=1 Tax=Nycticebus coucang TaxID=9470 RepID=UPI00234DB4E1|nr:proline-rich basic protein 1 [Nycticebus coucang]